ncbi:MAG: putative C-S lyase, partial [Anaerolineae bacterium]|nr:putative C-S lyase [Anaerolineae bacterium]
MTYDFDTPINRRGTDCLKWDTCAEDVLPLPVADMDFVAPEPVLRALQERLNHGVFGYSCEPAELREVIVDRLWERYGWSVSPEALLFLPGVIAGFNLACRTTAPPGTGILMQPPVYPPILGSPANHGLRRLEAPLVRGDGGRYQVDWGAFDRLAAEAHLFILCNPHNPVGRVFTRAELEQMAEVCLRHDLTVCSDEIHCDVIFSGSHHMPLASVHPEIARRTITLMAPSKTFNIPGIHCAFAVIPDADLRERYAKARAGMVGAPGVLGYAAGLAAYRDGDEWLAQALAYIEANRDFLVEFVERRLPGVTVSPVEGTFLAWLDCRESGIEGSPAQFFLQKARVALGDGAAFGKPGEGFARLNFACPRVTLTEGLDRMR